MGINKAKLMLAAAETMMGLHFNPLKKWFRPTGYSWVSANRSKYKRHQGAQECARRRAQIARTLAR